MKTIKYDAIIIGGGIYGCITALALKKYFDNICIIEKSTMIMSRATSLNQARIHNGYHYPRSFLTAMRSHINYSKFMKDYRSCIFSGYKSIYAIAKNNSKISAKQFEIICKQIGLPIKNAPSNVTTLFNPALTEKVFLTKEAVFDYRIFRNIILKKLKKENIIIKTGTIVKRVSKSALDIVIKTKRETYHSRYAFCCAYAAINTILKSSRLPVLPLKFELAEIMLIKVPYFFQKLGITIMDGPFFSILPFPSTKYHSLTHVRYTPHLSETKDIKMTTRFSSRYAYALRDMQRYIPSIKNVSYKKSLFEIKTLSTNNEEDDGRPIVFKKDYGIKNLFIILGGKIDNIYDIEDKIHATFKTTA